MLDCFLVDDLRLDDFLCFDADAGTSAAAGAAAPALDCLRIFDTADDDIQDDAAGADASAGAGAPAPVLDGR